MQDSALSCLLSQSHVFTAESKWHASLNKCIRLNWKKKNSCDKLEPVLSDFIAVSRLLILSGKWEKIYCPPGFDRLNSLPQWTTLHMKVQGLHVRVHWGNRSVSSCRWLKAKADPRFNVRRPSVLRDKIGRKCQTLWPKLRLGLDIKLSMSKNSDDKGNVRCTQTQVVFHSSPAEQG